MLLPRSSHVIRAVENASTNLLAIAGRKSRSRDFSTVAAVLKNRAILEVSGTDASALLQGLITNDISLLDKDECQSMPVAFLNPKGRVLGDALVMKSPPHEARNKPGYVLDCPLAITAALTAHLKTYKLRSKVKIKDVTHLYDVLVSGIRDPWKTVAEEAQKGSGGNVLSHSGVSAKQAAPGLMNTEYSARFEDPRCAALGTRLLRLKGNGGDPKGDSWALESDVVDHEVYEALRMLNGVAEGEELVDSIPLESNLDLLGFVSFSKGCYVGQELTARTQFKGFVRKRLLPIILPGEETLARSLPIQLVPSIMEKWTEQGPSDAVVRELVGSTVVNGETEDEKLGILGAVSPVYNVGLALLRFGKLLPGGTIGNEALGSEGEREERFLGVPLVECRIKISASTEPIRCLPLLPAWWPVNLDPATGKIPP